MEPKSPFADPAVIAGYAENTPRKVPGYADLHRMALVLLTEHVPPQADIIVLGAGGGLELRAFTQARPRWRFTGVDPSREMLDLARRVLVPLPPQVELMEGHIDDAPAGPYDGATCLLTLHFLSRPERLRTLRELRRRLKPGAPMIVAHHTCPQAGRARQWLARSVAFAGDLPTDSQQVAASATAMAEHLPLLSPEQEEAVLREAGFSDIALFYAGLTFRGWIALA